MPTWLLSAQRPLFDGDCDFVVARGASGEFGVLPGHAPLLTWLKPGELMLRQGHDEHFFFVEGGYMEVLPHRVSILAGAAVATSELDPTAAEEARRAADETLARAANPEPDELAELQRQLEVAQLRLAAAERDRRRRRD